MEALTRSVRHPGQIHGEATNFQHVSKWQQEVKITKMCSLPSVAVTAFVQSFPVAHTVMFLAGGSPRVLHICRRSITVREAFGAVGERILLTHTFKYGTSAYFLGVTGSDM